MLNRLEKSDIEKINLKVKLNHIGLTFSFWYRKNGHRIISLAFVSITTTKPLFEENISNRACCTLQIKIAF